MKSHFILYVRDQTASVKFYSAVLDATPILDVPGMTEFQLSADCVLGLMAERGIKKLLAPNLPDPSLASGIPRAEIYLIVDDCNFRNYLSRFFRNYLSVLTTAN
jgi:hypothetical protein